MPAFAESAALNRMRLQDEITEWKRFTHTMAAEISHQVHFTREFPTEDGEIQRFILTDLIHKLETVRENDLLEDPDYQRLLRENARTKQKLKQATRKCEAMLAVIRERGCHRESGYRSHFSPQPKVLQDFGTHVRELTGLTRKLG
jgi:hypothetical protein